MQRIALTKIMQDECNEYAFLFEKLLAFRSLKKIIKDGSGIAPLAGLNSESDILKEIKEDEKNCNHQINAWWDKMDEKYILEYDDSRVLALDFNDCIIYSFNKKEWYLENPYEVDK